MCTSVQATTPELPEVRETYSQLLGVRADHQGDNPQISLPALPYIVCPWSSEKS